MANQIKYFIAIKCTKETPASYLKPYIHLPESPRPLEPLLIHANLDGPGHGHRPAALPGHKLVRGAEAGVRLLGVPRRPAGAAHM